MPRSFTNQVTALAGDTTDYTDDLAQWLDDGVRYITDALLAENKQNAGIFSTKSANFEEGSPLTIESNQKVFRVVCTYDGRETDAKYIDPSLLEDARDQNSLHYRTQRDPAYTIETRLVELAGGGDTNLVHWIEYGTVNDGAGTVSEFPESLYRSLALYAAIKLMDAKINSLLEDDEDIELANAREAHKMVLQKEFAETLKPYGVSV